MKESQTLRVTDHVQEEYGMGTLHGNVLIRNHKEMNIEPMHGE